jgi:type III restriction enzyme
VAAAPPSQRTASIENPVINSPFTEPMRHFMVVDGQVSGDINEGRRPSEFFVPVAKPRKASPQLALQFGAGVKQQQNEIVNEIRQSVARWRLQGYPHTTGVTRELLAQWRADDRQRRLFFCQIEAAETAIYLTEAAEKSGDTKALNVIRGENARLNDSLPRLAFKMATGSGKTVVMGMFIAWQALNKLANPYDKRFSTRFLIVTPGITIKDRLRVLLPNDPQTFFRTMELTTPEQLDRLQAATIEITNYHAFIRRDKIEAAALTKRILAGPGGPNPNQFKETPAEMVRRVCRVFGNAKDIVVMNDEAHHCYTQAPPDMAGEGSLDADERTEAREFQEEARVWYEGLRAVREKIGIRAIFDVSATPFFLKGSGWPEGTLFPWVASDFGLMDAIESGIVKVPRVPVSDDSMVGELPRYRDLWVHVKDALPRKGLKDTTVGEGDPILPKELEGALESLHADYARSYEAWGSAAMGRPPVLIVVCSNTSVSKLVFDWIAGYDKPQRDGSLVPAPGKLPLFSNIEDGDWRRRPVTLLIDSVQIDKGELDAAFKKAAAREIEEYKREYVARFPGRSADEIEDEEILREVLNTVGKPGKLGEQIRCVVSVSMLTEGWDANTVTHILGIRAFGTQLLCEQVVGRALRRASYDANADGMFDPEYAEVLGVPFTFLSTTANRDPKPPKPIVTVRALPERSHLRIEFPRVMGYRYEMPAEKLTARFDEKAVLELSTRDVPTMTELDPIVGQMNLLELPLHEQRLNTVVFAVAKRTLDTYFKDDEGDRPWLFPQLSVITRRWIDESVTPYLGDGAYPQLLLLAEWSHAAAEKIHRAIVMGSTGEPRLLPILRPYDPIGSTDDVLFETTKTTFDTTKSHINRVAQDSSWETELAQKLEGMPEVITYAKNQGLNLKIPYTYEGRAANYVPDFLIRLRDRDSMGDHELLTLVLEVSGEAKKEKAAKVAAAGDLWVPAVNNWGGLGRWAFLEVTHMENAVDLIRARFVA